ncbi:MAG: hypothetical protein U0792_13770 [Gemmataceae bacterium]
MEHIPARHAACVGLQCPARVTGFAASHVTFQLDLTRVAPGRSPSLGAGLRFDRTLFPERVRRLRRGDLVDVVMIDVGEADPYDWVQVSLPAYPAWLTWNNETVRRLARQIRETGDTDQLPILADALQDAGCTDIALLTHCREPHTPGTRSWAVDLLATQQ